MKQESTKILFFYFGATDIPCFGLLVTSALGFKARVDVLCAFSLVWSSDSLLVRHLLTEVSMAAKPFWSMYLQTWSQALVEVRAGLGLEPTTVRAARSKQSTKILNVFCVRHKSILALSFQSLEKHECYQYLLSVFVTSIFNGERG